MLVWMLIGVALLIIELVSATFFIIFFGLAALTVAALAYFLTVPMHYELLCFAFCSFLYFICFRKLLKKKKKPSDIHNELVGQIGYVYEEIYPHQLGKVMLGDTSWSATATLQIQKGAQVRILSHNNLTLEVTPL